MLPILILATLVHLALLLFTKPIAKGLLFLHNHPPLPSRPRFLRVYFEQCWVSFKAEDLKKIEQTLRLIAWINLPCCALLFYLHFRGFI